MAEQGEITRLLGAVRRGEADAMDRLLPVVYGELRSLARRRLSGRRPGQTLETTALVHETYMRLIDQARADWRDRTHFLAVSAIAMRQILIDSARRRYAQKRGAGAHHTGLEDVQPRVEARAEEILDLDEALKRLAALNSRLSRTVELRYFGGLTEEETAQVLGVNRRTVQRDWKTAKAFLHHELADGDTGHGE